MRRKHKAIVGLVVLVIVIAVVGGTTWAVLGNKPADTDKTINTKEYQALFLTNGQVYFGKLSNLDDKYVTISNIYYLQVQQTATSQQSVQPASSTTSNSQVSLAKLGNELHGPEDKMSVASDQVLFWENLKGNSKVAQAIAKYQAGK